MVNVAEHVDGKKPSKDLTIAQALSGASIDPCVGKFLEFRIVRNRSSLTSRDLTKYPNLIPNPDLSQCTGFSPENVRLRQRRKPTVAATG